MDDGESYSGDSAYKMVEELLYSKGKTLRVVSPFIGKYYVRALVKIARRKRVYLITTARTIREERNLARYISKGGASPWLKTLAALLIAIAALLLLGAYIMALIAAQLLGAYAALLVAALTRPRPSIEVRFVHGKFVHEKLYISDRQAITGSANLTYSGMHKNLEHLDITYSPTRIRELTDHFQELWERAK